MVRNGVCCLPSDEFFRDDVLALIFNLSVSYFFLLFIFALLHRCDKRLQRLQKILCKRVYYFVNVYLNKNHMSETKQNYDVKPSYSALRSNRSLIEFIGSRC